MTQHLGVKILNKIKILETNKNLLRNAQELFEALLVMQTDAESQVKLIREIESKIVAIEKAKQEALEKQRCQENVSAHPQDEEGAKEAAQEQTKMESATAALPTQEPDHPEEKLRRDMHQKTAEVSVSEARTKIIGQNYSTSEAMDEKKSASDLHSISRKITDFRRISDEDVDISIQKGASKGKVEFDHNRKRPDKSDEEDIRNKRAKKAVIKKRVFPIDEDDFRKGSRKLRPKKQTTQRKMVIEPIKIEKAVITEETVSVKLFSEKIGKPVSDILKKLLLLGMMCTINSQIDFDTAQLVASEFDIDLEQKIEKTAEDILVEEVADHPEQLKKRPPVITIMGHVDHGKTSLLDKIRSSKVTESEAGGITQHIGAYQVELEGEKITFIDTPGHEAFTAMRARGAQVTDIAIIVVAADDGIMPQTIEAINHAKSADVPIIVAINKIDREHANIQRIMQDLTEHELLPEEWGGDTVVVPVSAKTGEGIDKLLEMILLVADVQELTANPNRLAKGTIVEAKLDKGRGPVATVLVETGTLHIGDTIIAGTAYGRVRAMLNDRGVSVEQAMPSQPVEVIGFSEVPIAGDILHAASAGALSKQVAEERKDRQKAEMLKKVSQVSLDDLFNQIAEGQIKDLNIVIKADVQGSVEAVRQSLEKLSNEEVRVRAIHCGVGAITETDIMLASAANAIIVGFNVRPDNMALGAAEREKVDVRLYRIIYKAIEDITKAMKGMLEPEYEEIVIGHAEVRQTFKVSSVGTIAGCYVTDGTIKRNAKARLLRDNIVFYEGSLSSLKRFKDDAREVASGYECGLSLENYNDVKELDVVECFEMREIER
jgi:translation initiation factor IF-2